MVLEPPGPMQSITSAWLQPTRPGNLAHGADPHQGLLAAAVPFVLVPVQGSVQLTQPAPHAHPHTPTHEEEKASSNVGGLNVPMMCALAFSRKRDICPSSVAAAWGGKGYKEGKKKSGKNQKQPKALKQQWWGQVQGMPNCTTSSSLASTRICESALKA